MHLISNNILPLLIIMERQIKYSVVVDQCVVDKMAKECNTLKNEICALTKEKMICC